MGNFLSGIIKVIVSVLPHDPFASTIANLKGSIPYLGEINYFIPFGVIVPIFLIWLTAYTTYLLWQAVARWAHLIK